LKGFKYYTIPKGAWGKSKKTALHKKALKNLQRGAARPKISGYVALGCFRRSGR